MLLLLLPCRIRDCLTQLYAKDITADDKQELDEALQREVRITYISQANMTTLFSESRTTITTALSTAHRFDWVYQQRSKNIVMSICHCNHTVLYYIILTNILIWELAWLQTEYSDIF